MVDAQQVAERRADHPFLQPKKEVPVGDYVGLGARTLERHDTRALCPFNIAGQQLGSDDDLDLFPAMLRLARELEPAPS